MLNRLAVVALGAALALGGCGPVNNEAVGMGVGGALGGVLGSTVGKGSGKTAATIVGALAGAYLGGQVGKSMDDTDRLKAQQALETSRTGQAYSWQNPDTRSSYAMTPTRTYDTSSGPCRDYTMDAWIDGQKEVVNGTACRQPDGTWKTI
jgi:surface antigen